jgi:hypothetical protein
MNDRGHARRLCLCGRALPKRADHLLYECRCGLTWVATEKLLLTLVQRQLMGTG